MTPCGHRWTELTEPDIEHVCTGDHRQDTEVTFAHECGCGAYAWEPNEAARAARAARRRTWHETH